MRHNFIEQHLAQESVAFQDDSFFKELTLVWKSLMEVKGDGETEKFSGMASAVVEKHTGFDVDFDIGIFDPCVEIPKIDRNNILVNSLIRHYVESEDGLKLVHEADNYVNGTVDIKRGRVTGIFTKIKHTIHMPTRMFASNKYTPEEVAAIVLHEVGHLFTYYEFLSRSVTTNQVLAGISKALDGSADIEQREHILTSAKKALKLSDLDVKELAKSKDKKVVEMVIITNSWRNAESELGSNLYDFSTWEYLSDQFAARHGAGRHLVTGLEKIYRSSFNIAFRSLPMYLAMEAVKVLVFAFVYTHGGIVAQAMGFFLTVLIGMDGVGDGTYDRPGARMKRIRMQIVENLKDPKLPKEDVARLQEDLHFIDAALEGVNDRRQWLDIAWDTMLPSRRKHYNQAKQQQELEEIATSELFARAADFRTLKLG